MSWLLEPLQHDHLRRALMICLLAGFANGYLSAFVVLRKSALQVGSLSLGETPIELLWAAVPARRLGRRGQNRS